MSVKMEAFYDAFTTGCKESVESNLQSMITTLVNTFAEKLVIATDKKVTRALIMDTWNSVATDLPVKTKSSRKSSPKAASGKKTTKRKSSNSDKPQCAHIFDKKNKGQQCKLHVFEDNKYCKTHLKKHEKEEAAKKPVVEAGEDEEEEGEEEDGEEEEGEGEEEGEEGEEEEEEEEGEEEEEAPVVKSKTATKSKKSDGSKTKCSSQTAKGIPCSKDAVENGLCKTHINVKKNDPKTKSVKAAKKA